MATTLLSPPPVDSERDTMAALAATCAHRPLVHMLVTRDLERWDKLTPEERAEALARARRRVDAVVPHPSLDFGLYEDGGRSPLATKRISSQFGMPPAI